MEEETVSSSEAEMEWRQVDVWHTGVFASSEVISDHCLSSKVFYIKNKTSAHSGNPVHSFEQAKTLTLTVFKIFTWVVSIAFHGTVSAASLVRTRICECRL